MKHSPSQAVGETDPALPHRVDLTYFLSFVQAMGKGSRALPRASLPSPCWATQSVLHPSAPKDGGQSITLTC